MIKKTFMCIALITNISTYTMLITRTHKIHAIHQPKSTISRQFNSCDINNNIIKHLNSCSPESAVEKVLTIALAPYQFTKEEKIYYIKSLFCRNDISIEQHKTLNIVQSFLEQQKSHPFYDQDQTLIHTATEKNNQLLLQASLAHNPKGSVNLPNKDGNSALYLASCNGHLKSVVILLYHCANINIQNNTGKTPFHGITTSPLINKTPKNNSNLLRTLQYLKYYPGANSNIPDNHHQLPIDYVSKALKELENHRPRTLHNKHAELMDVYHDMEKILRNPGCNE